MCCLFHKRLQSYQGNMANFEIEEEPMLSERYARRSDRLEDSNFRRLISRTRSAPMSIPMVSMEPYDREIRPGGNTSPLRSVRETPLPQMSGPPSATHGTGNPVQQSIVVTGNIVAGNRTENFSTLRGTGESHWSNNYDRENEHLLRSGQLGMCNDPYCTTCPTYFKAAQQGNSRTSNRVDPKVSFSLN